MEARTYARPTPCPAEQSAGGVVFDIHRFALHDGPGIRTTVFLKGCPLRCLWCHNPESQSFKPELSFRREKCTDCSSCVSACSHGAHRVVDGRHEVDFARTKGCGACVSACPHGALEVIGRETTVEEVMSVVRRDEAYYKRSGGGVTLSGGEPLAQFAFAGGLLRAAKAEGLHTCLDTCGHIPWDRMRAVMDDVDLFLFDYKATGAAEHKRLTGVSNNLILRNLDFLYRFGARILLRCPLVPGVNDSPEHLRGIAGLAERYPDLVGIELMPYHSMAREKAVRIGRTEPLPTVATATDEQKAAWLEAIAGYGCANGFISYAAG